MLTVESKLYLGGAGLALVAAVAYFAGSGGDRMGAVLFLSAMAAAALIGLLFVGRPTPLAAEPTAAEPVAPDGVSAPAGLPAPTAWPVAAALAAGLLLVGIVLDKAVVVLGLGAVVLAAAGWFLQTWREHVTAARPEAIEAHRRVLWPAGLPLLAFMGIAVLVISFSRILLALPEKGATGSAVGAAVLILGGSTVVALRPARGGLMGGLVGVAALAVIVGGVAAASHGQRHIKREAAPTLRVVARSTSFLQRRLVVHGEDVVIDFVNRDADLIHNIAVYTNRSAANQVYFGDAVNGRGTRIYSFRAPRPGTYFYRCEFHPTAMTGTLEVKGGESA